MSDMGSEVRPEVNAGITTVSRMMEHLETRDSDRTTENSPSTTNLVDGSVAGPSDQHVTDNGGDNLLRDNTTNASCAAGSSSN